MGYAARAAFQSDDVLVSYFSSDTVRQYRDGAFVKDYSGVAGARVGAAAQLGGHLVTAYRAANTDGIAIYAANGNELDHTPLSLYVPTDVTLFADGTIAIASQNANVVTRMSEAGASLGTISNAHTNAPFGLAVAPDDTLWVVSRTSQHVDHFGRNGADLGGFSIGYDGREIAIDPDDGTLWIANNTTKEVDHRTKSGAEIDSPFATSVVGDFDGLGILSDGRLLVMGLGASSIEVVTRAGVSLGTEPITPNSSAFRIQVVPEPSAAAGAISAFAVLAACRFAAPRRSRPA